MPKRKKKSVEQKKTDERNRKRKARTDDEFRLNERAHQALRMRENRKDPEFLAEDQARRASQMRKLREDANFLEDDRARCSSQMESLRKDPEFLADDHARRAAEMKRSRQEPQFLANDQARRASQMRKMRDNPKFLKEDRLRCASLMETLREDPEFLADDHARRAAEMKRSRQEPQFLANDQARRASQMKRSRQEPQFLANDQARRASQMRKMRDNPKFLKEDRLRCASIMETLREDPQFLKEDQIRCAAKMTALRTDPEFCAEERANTSSRMRKCREDPEYARKSREINRIAMTKSRKLPKTSFDAVLEKFESEIWSAPTNTCSCCGVLCYKEQVSHMSIELLKTFYTESQLNKVVCVNIDELLFCNSCKDNIKKQKIPRLSLANGLQFAPVPDVLKGLTQLEERMVAAIIPFAQIRLLRSQEQWGLKGNVVNVENDLNICLGALPRKFNETSVVQLKFKRRIASDSHYLYDRIRPKRVYEAAKYLVYTPLYRKQNIVLAEDWDDIENEEQDFIVDNEDADEAAATEDPSEEEDDFANVGADETFLYNENNIRPMDCVIAPGEGKTPIYNDDNCEFLCFPTNYCGQEMKPTDPKITFTDRAKSQLKRYDRRFAKPEYIFYAFKKLSNEKIRNAYLIHLRQRKRGEKVQKMVAKNFKNKSDIQEIFAKDDGYAVFKNIRSSPAYWKEQTKRVVAMVRQFGTCSFFLTLSAAETKWKDLHNSLGKVNYGNDFDASQLSKEQIRELIKQDPVTCSRHFDRRFRTCLNTLITKPNGVFAPHQANDHYCRIEYQMRGSPHAHCLLWMDEAPIYDHKRADSEAEVVAFIDQHITCCRDEEGEMENLIGMQIHRHSHSCKKPGSTAEKCRFHFPRPPMPTTKILHPLPADITKENLAAAKKNYRQIRAYLVNLGRSYKENMDFDEFLSVFNISESDYYLAVRSSIKRPQVFLARQTSEIFVNSYNKKLLLAWKANMDIQYVLDPYACAKYVVSYVSKAEGGISKLLRAAAEEARKGNHSIKDKLLNFAKILITGSEISAQEAVAFLLGLPNTFCNTSCVYINTARRDDRIGILKPTEEIQQLPDDSDDILSKGLLDHYIQRPSSLEYLCLADFAALYDFSKKGRAPKRQSTANQTSKDPDGSQDARGLPLKDGSGYLHKRFRRKIIRFRHFNKATEENDYYREQVMLFIPWRNEEIEVVQNPIKKYHENEDLIEKNSKPFYSDRKIDEGRLGEWMREIEDDDDDEIEHTRDLCNEFDIVEDERHLASFLTDMRPRSRVLENILPPKMIDHKEYLGIMRSLNTKQRQITNHVLHWLKTKDEPFKIFLSGGAGVGKSHVITAIVQSYLRFRSGFQGTADEIPVVVSAFTGKAAFNVFGMTLHTAFKLQPLQKAGKLTPLSENKANTLRVKFAGTKLFVFDEISMIPAKFFGFVDERMRQLFDPNKEFGGKSILVVGDFRQLPPIGFDFVFDPPADSDKKELAKKNPLWKDFEYFQLDEIMRQRGEVPFCKALNNLAEGVMDSEDIKLFKSRQITPTNQPPPEAIHLFWYNKDCDEYNRQYHAQLGTQGAVSTAFDRVIGRGTDEEKENLKNAAPLFNTQESDGVPYKINLQISGFYQITTNIDVSDGLFNGASGILRHIEFGKTATNETIPVVAWLKFCHPLIGANQSKRYLGKFQRPAEVPETCIPIERITKSLSYASQFKGNLELVRAQIPLMASNGMTIMKSQGSSLTHVVVHPVAKRQYLNRPQMYVACSRATSINGLWIAGEFQVPEAPEFTDRVTKELKDLRGKPVTLLGRDFCSIKATTKFYFQNIQSFRMHHLDLAADPTINCADYLAFVEPHLPAARETYLEGFECLQFVRCKQAKGGQTNSEGILVLQSASKPAKQSQHPSQDKIRKGHCIINAFQTHDSTWIFVCYKHPEYDLDLFLEKLTAETQKASGSRILIVGDCNVDLSSPNIDSGKLISTLQTLGLQTRLDITESTTNYKTHLDICFSNFNDCHASIYDTYFSYHRGICINW